MQRKRLRAKKLLLNSLYFIIWADLNHFSLNIEDCRNAKEFEFVRPKFWADLNHFSLNIEDCRNAKEFEFVSLISKS
jgi:hypothetical protein